MFQSKELKAKNAVQSWKASVKHKLEESENGMKRAILNYQGKIENRQRMDIQGIELVILTKLRIKFYTKLQDNITLIFNNITGMFKDKNLSGEVSDALYYLRCVQLSDKQDISKKAIESLASFKGEKPKEDPEAQVALSRIKMSAEDAIKYTVEFAREVGDNDNMLLNVLRTKREYKQKVEEYFKEQEELNKQNALQEQQRMQQEAVWAQQRQQMEQINQPYAHVAYGNPSPMHSPIPTPPPSNGISGQVMTPSPIPSPIPTPPPSNGIPYPYPMGLEQPSYPSTDLIQPFIPLPPNQHVQV